MTLHGRDFIIFLWEDVLVYMEETSHFLHGRDIITLYGRDISPNGKDVIFCVEETLSMLYSKHSLHPIQ